MLFGFTVLPVSVPLSNTQYAEVEFQCTDNSQCEHGESVFKLNGVGLNHRKPCSVSTKLTASACGSLPSSGQERAVQLPDPGTPGSRPPGGMHRQRWKKRSYPAAGSRPGSPGCRGCSKQPGGSSFEWRSGILVPLELGWRSSDHPAKQEVRRRPSPNSDPRSLDSTPQTVGCCSWFHSRSGSCTLEKKHTLVCVIRQNNWSFIHVAVSCLLKC